MGLIFSEASGLNKSIYGDCQMPIKMFLEKKAEAHENKSIAKEIFSMEKSSSFGESLTGMTSMNTFEPVAEGGAYPENEMQEGYKKTITHTTFKSQFAITQEMVEDSKLMNLKKKPANFVSSYYRTRELFGASLLGHAIQGKADAMFNGMKFDTKAADGVCLFADNHPSILGKSVQSNRITNAFSVDTLGKAEEAMQNFVDDNDTLLGVIPDTIIIPNSHALKKAVFAAIGADQDPETANNGFNYQYGRWNVIVWAYLNQFLGTETQPWILASSEYNEENGGAVWFDRVDLSVKSYIDEKTDDNIWKGRARFSGGFNDWRAFLVGGVSSGTTL